MNLTERMEAHSKTLRYQFFQADKRDWPTFTQCGWVDYPPGSHASKLLKCFTFQQNRSIAVNDNRQPRNELEIWGHWYKQAMVHQWKRCLGF